MRSWKRTRGHSETMPFHGVQCVTETEALTLLPNLQTKTYHMSENEDNVLESAEGTKIQWVSGKNPTVKVRKKCGLLSCPVPLRLSACMSSWQRALAATWHLTLLWSQPCCRSAETGPGL